MMKMRLRCDDPGVLYRGKQLWEFMEHEDDSAPQKNTSPLKSEAVKQEPASILRALWTGEGLPAYWYKGNWDEVNQWQKDADERRWVREREWTF